MRLLLALLSVPLAACAAVNYIGPESNFTHELKPLTTAAAWRDKLGILGIPIGATNYYITNLYVSNFFTTNITIITTNGPINGIGGVLTASYIPVATDEKTLADSPMQKLDATSVQWGNAVLTNSLTVTGSGTNTANNLEITDWLRLLNPTAGGPAVFVSAGTGYFLTNGTPTISDGTNTTVVQLGPFTPGVYPVADGTNTLTDGYLYAVATTNVGFNGQFIWGPGATKRLRAMTGISDTNALAFNTSTDQIWSDLYFTKDGSAQNVYVGGTWSGGNAIGHLLTSGSLMTVGYSGANMNIGSGAIYPNTPASLALGLDQLEFGDVRTRGTVYVVGHSSGSGVNYSRLALSHSGTNGAAIFDSQSAGTAGAARNFIFSTNGVTRFTLDGVNATFIASNAGQSSSYGTDSGGTGIITPGNSLLRIYGDTDARKNLVVNAETGASQGLTVYGQSINNIITAQSGFVNVQLNANNVGSTLPTGYGFSAYNAQAATAGQVQNSPSVYWRGTAWSTNDAASELVGMVSHIAPISGGARPTGKLTFTPIVHTNTLSSVFYISTEGPVKLASLTKAQKTALTDVSDGMLVYQTDNTPGLRAYVNGGWVILSTGADP